MKVKLLEYTSPFLVVLAYKVSRGKVREKGLEHYQARFKRGDYESGKLCRYLLSSAREWPSALEHVVFTFYIEGCSRVCSHQLVRHRLASYTQESQRYTRLCMGVDWDEWMRRVRSKQIDKIEEYIRVANTRLKEQFVIPETIKGELENQYLSLLRDTCLFYNYLVKHGIPEEDARFILPQSAKTSLLMTVNLRELLHIAKLRLDEKAQWEIRRVVNEMINEVERVIPCIREMVKTYKE